MKWTLSVRQVADVIGLIILTIPTGAHAADPPGFSAAAKWTFNDNSTDVRIYPEYINGFNGHVTNNDNGGYNDLAYQDTPGGTNAGQSVKFLGGRKSNDGNIAQDSVIEANSLTGYGSFFPIDGVISDSESPGGGYSYYEGSRTVSAWIKIAPSEIKPDEHHVVFYHGRPVVNMLSVDRTYQFGPDQSTNPGNANAKYACRAFALGIYAPPATSNTGYIFFGSTNGDWSTQHALFLLDPSSATNGCNPNVISSSSTGAWHHIVGVFSLDLMALGANSALIYIDGQLCGSGKIVHPYTDVGTSTATYHIGSALDQVSPNGAILPVTGTCGASFLRGADGGCRAPNHPLRGGRERRNAE